MSQNVSHVKVSKILTQEDKKIMKTGILRISLEMVNFPSRFLILVLQLKLAAEVYFAIPISCHMPKGYVL